MSSADLSGSDSAVSAVNQQLQQLYSDHQPWLLSWLGNRLGCRQQAADLSQDTFVRLLKKQQYLSLQEPRAFLTAVAKRVLANHWRREQLEQAYLQALAQTPESFAPSEEERAILFETLYHIDRLLDGLPVVVKQAFLYAQLDGLKQAEIARKLNISVTSVKRHLVRATAQCYFAIGNDES
ncbi:sigma-70 family RNA polymerase sigma factor [Bacterioplanoides sp.]|uniref:sigma-70 family RNA polymerase sigma factor n=1 Tax=Bacterioplanoides sp. TaxID=2066072 RepID=UPI003B5D03A6